MVAHLNLTVTPDFTPDQNSILRKQHNGKADPTDGNQVDQLIIAGKVRQFRQHVPA